MIALVQLRSILLIAEKVNLIFKFKRKVMGTLLKGQISQCRSLKMKPLSVGIFPNQ